MQDNLPNEVYLTIPGQPPVLYIRQHIASPQSKGVDYQPAQQPIQQPAQPPLQNGVMCNCGIPAEFQRGHSEKTGRDWARYVCSKPPRDPQNCGFKKWVD